MLCHVDFILLDQSCHNSVVVDGAANIVVGIFRKIVVDYQACGEGGVELVCLFLELHDFDIESQVVYIVTLFL